MHKALIRKIFIRNFFRIKYSNFTISPYECMGVGAEEILRHTTMQRKFAL